VKQGARLTKVGANPIPIPHPTNLALFGHKITQGLKFEQGAEPPHFNHCSNTDTPKDMAGVPVLKLPRQWPIGVLAPPPMNRSVLVM